MAQIVIKENDLTSSPAGDYTDVVYVPGMLGVGANGWNDAYYGKPLFFTSLNQFQNIIGKSPAKLVGDGIEVHTAEQAQGVNHTFFAINGQEKDTCGKYDTGYIYAANLLALGMPIYYEVADTTKEDHSARAMYAAMAGDYKHEVSRQENIAVVIAATETGELTGTITTTFTDTDRAYEFAGWKLGTAEAFIDATDVTLTAAYFNASGCAEFKATFAKKATVKTEQTIQYITTDTVLKAAVGQFTYSNGDFVEKQPKPTESSAVSGLQVTFPADSSFAIGADAYKFTNFKSSTSTGSSKTWTVFNVNENDLEYTVQDADGGKVVILTFAPAAVAYEGTEQTPVLVATILGRENVTVKADLIQLVHAHGNTNSMFDKLADRGTYNVKYITSGGYPTYEYNNNIIVNRMLHIAGAINDRTDDYMDDPYATGFSLNGRGDCLALIDHFYVQERPLLGEGSIYETINTSVDAGINGLKGATCLSYGAMFTPYLKYNLFTPFVDANVVTSQQWLPASFAYLVQTAAALGNSLPSYDSIAGVTRGKLSNVAFDSETNNYSIGTKDVLTNYVANYYQVPMKADDFGHGAKYAISINAITQINPYGLVIYGDRTLSEKSITDGVKATSIICIRNMVSDIKKQLYKASRRYMYSQNTAALFFNFRSMITPLLDKMIAGYGIKKYDIAQVPTNEKNAIYAKVTIVPIYPVEKFDIVINIQDNDIESSDID